MALQYLKKSNLFALRWDSICFYHIIGLGYWNPLQTVKILFCKWPQTHRHCLWHTQVSSILIIMYSNMFRKASVTVSLDQRSQYFSFLFYFSGEYDFLFIFHWKEPNWSLISGSNLSTSVLKRRTASKSHCLPTYLLFWSELLNDNKV